MNLLMLLILLLGIVITIIGILLIILSMFLSTEKESESKIEYGGVLIIGPLPIVFGNRTKSAIIALILAIVLTILSIILFIITTRGLIQ